MHHSVHGGEVVVAEVAIGILRKEYSFTYLGYPIFYKRKQKLYYQQLIQRIGAKIQGWKERLLSYGGREILIKHVLQSTPIHCLSVMNPPINVLTQIQKMLAQYFWSSCIGGRGRQWSSWKNLCLLVEERGLGFRLIRDISMPLFYKIWWNVRTKKSAWSKYMMNKYCKHKHPTLVMWKVGDGGSQIWKKMLQARDLIYH